MAGETLRGVVKWFNDAKGFGFIEHQTGRDVFVHYSVIESDGFKTLKDGEQVEYELKEGEKGLNAARVIRLSQPATAAKQTDQQLNGAGAATIESQIEVEVVPVQNTGSSADYAGADSIDDQPQATRE